MSVKRSNLAPASIAPGGDASLTASVLAPSIQPAAQALEPARAAGARTAARALADLAYRWWYVASMYTGTRAWRNRWKSRRGRLDPRLPGRDGVRIDSDDLGEVLLWAHPRTRRGEVGDHGNHGMISVRPVAPGVGRMASWYFRCTSHFGQAHAEVAFLERAGEVTVYGVRNIASANARRLGLSRLAERLRLAGSREEERLLRAVSEALGRAGLTVRLAPPRECVDLSVSERLLPPGRSARVRAELLRRYARLAAATRERAS